MWKLNVDAGCLLIYLFIYSYFMNMGVVCAGMFVHHMNAWDLWLDLIQKCWIYCKWSYRQL